MDSQNNQCGPLHSSQAEPLAAFPDHNHTDLSNIETASQILGHSNECMRELRHPETALSVVARIPPMGAQTPAYTPIHDHIRKPADPPRLTLSSQSTLLTVPQQHLRFLPSPPMSSSTDLLSPFAANLWADERPSGTLDIASASTTAVSLSELAISGDERSDLVPSLRTHTFSSSSTPPSVAANTCDYPDPSGISVPSSSTTQWPIPLSEDFDLCVATTVDARQAGYSPDEATRHLPQDSMADVSVLLPSIFSCHDTAVPAGKTLATFPDLETDTAVGTMDPGPMLSTTPSLPLVLLSLDTRPAFEGPGDCLSVSDVLSDAALVPRRPETPPGDLVTEDDTPQSAELPLSSLPASQISDLSLSDNYANAAVVSDSEDSSSWENTKTLNHGRGEDDDLVVQTSVGTDMLTWDSYGATSKSPRLSLGTSVDQDVASDLLFSSPPPSSPPGLFSSPTRSVSASPPSSSPPGPPCDVDDQLPTPGTKDVGSPSPRSPLKRVREADDPSETAEISSAEYRPLKRTKPEPSSQVTPPNPTRPSQVSQTRQHKKLIAPFRSPIIKGPLVHGGLHAVYASGRAVAPMTVSASKRLAEENATETGAAAEFEANMPNKDRTARAAKQFKPPMQVASPIVSSESTQALAAGTILRVGAVSTIQALQGQVQMLKQAIKIKNSGDGSDDEVLEQLAEKWTAVGREVAWALWDHVKDLDPGTGAPPQQGGWYADEDDVVMGSKRAFDPGWGYDGPMQKKARMDDDVDQEEPPAVQHTIGVMLRRLGIDPDTLGWNEDEGDFVDM